MLPDAVLAAVPLALPARAKVPDAQHWALQDVAQQKRALQVL